MNTTVISSAAAAILNNEQTKNFVKKIFRKLYKKIFLKPVTCIVVNDLHRKKLNFDFDDKKYQLLDLDEIYNTMLSEAESIRLKLLKVNNVRIYTDSVKQHFKKILNTIRESYKNEKIILLLSNMELVYAMHVKDVTCYIPDDDLQEEIELSVDEYTRKYIKINHKNLENHKNTVMYKSLEQLNKMLHKRFK